MLKRPEQKRRKGYAALLKNAADPDGALIIWGRWCKQDRHFSRRGGVDSVRPHLFATQKKVRGVWNSTAASKRGFCLADIVYIDLDSEESCTADSTGNTA